MNNYVSFCSLIFFSLNVRDVRSADILRYYGAAGENLTYPCFFTISGAVKIFCRETCEGSNLLVKTSSDSAQEGRYGTQYVKEASKTFSVLSVSITELTWSDSGRYRCGLDDSSSSASYLDFRLVIVDALLDGNADHHLYKEPGSSLTVACSFKGSANKWQLIRRGAEGDVLVQTDGAETGRYKVEYEARKKSSILLVTIMQLIQSDSGHYRCKIDRMIRPDLYIDFSITVTKAADPSTSTQTTSLTLSSGLGSFASSVSSETSGLRKEIQSASHNESNHSFVLMLLSLTITVFLVSVALMVFCRISFKKVQTAPAVQMEQTVPAEAAPFYQNQSNGEQLWRSVDSLVYLACDEFPSSEAAGAAGSSSETDEGAGEAQTNSQRDTLDSGLDSVSGAPVD